MLPLFIRPKPIQVPTPVIQICKQLTTKGFQAFLVGGAVRDQLLKAKPTDWDITTDAYPEIIAKIFHHTVTTGKRFGTITVLHDGYSVEVTTMRSESTYSDGRHPDAVKFCRDLQLDLARRDFTINAIAYDPLTERYIDPYLGMKDLSKKLIRTVGNANTRFCEDALRMLRLIRLSAVLDFKPDKTTLAGFQPQLINKVANERIKVELDKLLLAENITTGLKLMFVSGIMAEILPELARCANVYQGDYHHLDVLGHSIIAAQATKPILHLRLAALLHDIGKPDTYTSDESGIHFYGHDKLGAKIAKSILQRFTYAKQLREKVTLLIKHHMFQIHPRSSDKAIRRFMARVKRENIHDLLELRKADIMAMKHNPRQAWEYYKIMAARINEIVNEKQALSVNDLVVSGTDLINELDLSPGPKIGKILDHLLQLVLDDPELNTYGHLIQAAKTYINQV